MNAFINSQFGYCPLVWMLHSRRLNTRINRIRERALRVVFKDSNSSFDELLVRNNSVSIHIRNIQLLAIELHKVANGLSPEIMLHVSPLRESMRYPTKNIFKSRNLCIVKYGTDSLSYLGPTIWSVLPDDFKNIKSLNVFKIKIKQWKPVPGVGYIEST